MSIRLTAEEFIGELKTAPEWALRQGFMDLTGALELYVKRGDEEQIFIGPDLFMMDDAAAKAWMAEVEELVKVPDIALNRVG